eukprot:791304-Pyramimonas_sp.AAC.1
MPDCTCQVANFLFPQGRVVSGHSTALAEAQKMATAKVRWGIYHLGIYRLPSCDWFSHAGYIPPPLPRWVLTLGIYRLPSCDSWSAESHASYVYASNTGGAGFLESGQLRVNEL